jgi:hypothetical protein
MVTVKFHKTYEREHVNERRYGQADRPPDRQQASPEFNLRQPNFHFLLQVQKTNTCQSLKTRQVSYKFSFKNPENY